MIQQLLFPNGIPYDFETGFGTAHQIESYLLIKKIADKSAKYSNLVAATGIEPVTLGLWVLRSNQLSYAATRDTKIVQSRFYQKLPLLTRELIGWVNSP